MEKEIIERECTLTDAELIKKIDWWNGQLCKSGGATWTLRIPPDVNYDPDMLIAEMTKRFEKLSIQFEGKREEVTLDEIHTQAAVFIQTARGMGIENADEYRAAFASGAKWMRDKLQGKEK